MKIFLIRHAQSEQNCGNFDRADSFVKITKKGEEQAKDCGTFLENYVKENNINISKSAFIISPFLRARQTANIINEKLNIQNVNYDYFLIERIFGVFDTFTQKDREKYFKKNKSYHKYFKQTGKFYTQYPSGESVYDVVLRMKMFINTTLKNLDNSIENVFIVSHAYTITAFIMAYFNYLPEWMENKFETGNCSVRLIENNTDFGLIYGGESNVIVST